MKSEKQRAHLERLKYLNRSRGKGYVNTQGYLVKMVGPTNDRRERLVHRIVMEEHLGRKLERSEVVHHKDGNRLNNDIENLELTTQRKHLREHDPANISLPGRQKEISHQRWRR
jgi:hypothetical protein